MLWIIGLGIYGFKGLSKYAFDILKDIDIILFEDYTSPIYYDIKELESIIDKEVKIVQRWYVEDGRELLSLAEKNNIALLVYGDPLIATTHMDLIIRAKERSIRVKVIHNASSITSIIGETGLHIYKLGSIATIVNNKEASKSVYKVIYNNLKSGLHTLLLLEYDKEKNFFLDPSIALRYLLDYEQEFKLNAINNDTYIIIASRVGEEDERIIASNLSSFLEYEFGKPPHSIIIPGSLHFTEEDSLKYISLSNIRDNSKYIKIKSEEMVKKYIPKARRALEKAYAIKLDGLNTYNLLDNAKRYIDDAELFMQKGEYELAILSIGYGEGLLDALGYLTNIDLWNP